MKLLYSLVFLTTLSAFVSHAQEGEFAALTPDDYAILQLPPLQILFENAKKSAAIEYYNLQLERQESLLKTEKRSWLKYFAARAGYQYGKTGILSYSEDNLSLFQYSDTEQSYYNIGGSVSIPIDDLFDRPNRVKRQRLEMEATKVEVEKWHDEQKIKIADAYFTTTQLLEVVKVRIEILTFAETQYRIAENNFVNGKIDEQELGNQKRVQADAIVDYEQTKASLNQALFHLEVLSKTRILK